MRWRKIGRIFSPENEYDWMVSHAANCAAWPVDGNRFRVYFSTRDRNNRSSIGWIEVDLRDPTRVVAISKSPVLSPGEIGTFDDSGVSLACIVRDNNSLLLYYTGWNLGVTVPWRNSIGLAMSS